MKKMLFVAIIVAAMISGCGKDEVVVRSSGKIDPTPRVMTENIITENVIHENVIYYEDVSTTW